LFGIVEAGKGEERTSTFSDNITLPIHRWFRYSAGFSAAWVEQLIEREQAEGRKHVLDPFAGSATTLLESELAGVASIGIDAHPFVSRVAQAKLKWREDPKLFHAVAHDILMKAKSSNPDPKDHPPLITKCFPPEALFRLDALYASWQSQADGSGRSELIWLAIISILRECSPVGTAQWQYVLPNKNKAKVFDPYEAFQRKVLLMQRDMEDRQRHPLGPPANFYQEDARDIRSVPGQWADLVITSPPYANNYDYADAARLELSFMGEVRSWGDLQHHSRAGLVRSCTQHVAALKENLESILEDVSLEPIRKEIKTVCQQLAHEKEGHGGKKPYDAMIASYFLDLARVWKSLRRTCASESLVCFVVGDSAPYGIYVPVDKWLGELALTAGFKEYSFEKTRDRNIKWKNRKHRVPLHEGRLWVKG
jgi:hypothetical protein